MAGKPNRPGRAFGARGVGSEWMDGSGFGAAPENGSAQSGVGAKAAAGECGKFKLDRTTITQGQCEYAEERFALCKYSGLTSFGPKLLRGERRLTVGHIRKLARCFNVEPGDALIYVQ